MPTSRHRHTVTESDAVSRALADAARRWPQDEGAPGRLLLRLIEEGRRSVAADADRRIAARREGVRRTSGALSGAFERGYLDQLRDDWRT